MDFSNLSYLEDVVRDLYQQYLKYPTGNKIRYEVFVGEDDSEHDTAIDAYNARRNALDQLKEEGIVLDYTLKDKTEEVARAEFFSDVMTYVVAECLVNKKKLVEHIKLLDTGVSETEDRGTLITKDTRGVFQYDGNPIEMPEASIYYEALDALYSRCDQSGFASYDDIDKHLVSCGREELEGKEKRDRRIKNATTNKTQGLFRYAKVNGKPLKNQTPDGKELVKVLRGKGLILNNPRV